MKKIMLLFVIIASAITTNAQQSLTPESFKFTEELKQQIRQYFRDEVKREPVKQENGKSAVYNTNIDEATAQQIAKTFISSMNQYPTLKSGDGLRLVYKAEKSTTLKSSSGSKPTTYFYVYSSSKSFVIVSGDDRAVPILGYSNTSSFDPGNIPPNLKNWLNGYEKEIQYALENDIEAGQETTRQWSRLLQGENTNTTEILSPLLETYWAQEPFYNDLCPFHEKMGKRTVAGCTAVAMAQIMKYWNYPVKGTGFHSYIPKTYPELGTISADFENTQYDWGSMPDSISEENYEVARLIYHCGVSVEMDYGINNSWGTFQFYNHPSALLAFRNNFGYKHTNIIVKKSNYSTSNEWINLIKEELNKKRPVLYSGGIDEEENEQGHSFVCDGYDSNNYFHFNWGWGGLANGYFSTDVLNIYNIIDLSANQDAIIQIEPLTINPAADIRYNSKIAISPSEYLTPGQPFSFKTKFKNFGAAKFEGTILAYVTSEDFSYFAVVGSPKTFSLESGESTEELAYLSNGLTLSPGKYWVQFLIIFPDNSQEVVDNNLTRTGVYQYSKIVISNNNTITSDEFENNDLENTAFELKPVFTNDIASFKIQANIHSTSDIDYYKIKFPTGYNYKISSLLIDISLNYYLDLDGKLSFKSENSPWSSPEDACIPEFTYSGDDKFLYFKIEPYLPCYIGNYELSFDIEREEKPATSINKIAKIFTSVYPNPSKGNLTLKLGNENRGKNEVEIYNINGKLVYKLLLENTSEILKNISLDAPNGIYILKIKNSDRIETQKIVIEK